MKRISVGSRNGDYEICVGHKLLDKAGHLLKRTGARGKVMIVTSRGIPQVHRRNLRRALAAGGYKVSEYALPDGELAKSSDQLFKLYRAFLKAGLERRDTVVALGGGVVGDVSGFAASTYLRGIAFVNIGTTLLAQVDSSIGGKTAINLKAGKNLVGAIVAPRMVISDVALLRTLPKRQLHASMAEVIKYGMIRDSALFRLLERSPRSILSGDPGSLASIVAASSRIKARVVTRDEFETKGERMILNYGHTFGHAFEKVLGYRRLAHGEAVAIGMIAAARLAVHLKMIGPQVEARQHALIKSYKLPDSLKRYRISVSSIMRGMMHDKKKRAGRLVFILPERIGKVVAKDRVPQHLVRKILKEIGARSS